MGETPNNALVHIDGKAADTLVKKIAKAVGGIFRPYQIKRVAKAEAEAALIKATSNIQISELQQRAMHRFIEEQAQHQLNMEAIAERAIPQLVAGADAEAVDDDWIANFFDKVRIVSNEEMQVLWSKILAGEVNAPGTFSRRTVNAVASLETSECRDFANLCRFGWIVDGLLAPLVFDTAEPIYADHGITYGFLRSLDSIDLIMLSDSGYRKPRVSEIRISYFGAEFLVDNGGSDLQLGKVMLTNTGVQLAALVDADPIPAFLDYVTAQWARMLKKRDAPDSPG